MRRRRLRTAVLIGSVAGDGIERKAITGVNENDRNQVDIGPYLRTGSNDLRISVATPLRTAVAVAPATPATGQIPDSSATIGTLQGARRSPPSVSLSL